ncbi:MAG TPA: 2-isopropylmalate synthase [Clostridiales bacterium]|nr:2-isopropylmalate synthase [Clostridiales bacterium]
MPKRIYIFDTSLRDGEQSPGVNLNVKEKLEIGRQLERLGVDVIEAGFPIASQGDFEGVKAIAETLTEPIITALARAVKGDIDRAWEAIKGARKPRIHTFIATSPIHMQYKLKKSPEEVLNQSISMVKYARHLCPDVEFSPEDATRTEREFLYRVIEGVIDAGATVVNIPDTVGYMMPDEFGSLIADIRNNVPNIDKATISVHCHNDLGLAVANSLAAIKNGASQVECTVNGIGERAGNAALEEIVMAIKTRSDYLDYTTNINTEAIYRTSMLVSRLTGMHLQPNKAIVGSNAFAHESGIHQHGVLSHRKTYEIMTPESIGLKQSQMVLGKHSGRHAFEERLRELGYTSLDKKEIDEAFTKFKVLADKKKHVLDRDIEAIINQKAIEVPQVYELIYFHISSGNTLISTSTVKLKCEKGELEEAACGSGPIDATFKAISRATELDIKLEDYSLRAITSGADALGESTVRIRENGEIFTGRGVSTDIVEASAKAYVNAINKMLYELG